MALLVTSGGAVISLTAPAIASKDLAPSGRCIFARTACRSKSTTDAFASKLAIISLVSGTKQNQAPDREQSRRIYYDSIGE